MNIFLSVGATYTRQQEKFVSAFETFLVQNGCVRLTVGRGNYTSQQPILRARDLMQGADAVVVIAFTRTIVKEAVEKPDTKEQLAVRNIRYPTIWNQLEAAMAFGLNLPILVIIENGLHQEAMLKDRMEFRALTSELTPDLFGTDEFKGVFADFQRIAKERRASAVAPANEPPKSIADILATATVVDVLRGLRLEHVLKIGGTAFSIAAASAGAAYWAAKHLP